MTNVVRAALWMSGAIVSFTSMAIAGRAVSLDHDTFEIMLFRSILGILIVVSIAGVAGTLGEIKRRSLALHGLRNLAHFAGQNLWFYALTLIPLAQVFALEFTSPIWVMVLAPLVLQERFTAIKAVAGMLAIVGVLLVARPGIAEINPGLIAAALAAIGFAITALCTKLLTRTETITCIMFWLTVMQALFGLIFAGYDGDISLPTASSLPWLAMIGAAGLLAHFCITRALQAAPASVVMPIDFVRLPVIVVVGIMLYDEPFETIVIIGACLIFLGIWLNIRDETKRSGSKVAGLTAK